MELVEDLESIQLGDSSKHVSFIGSILEKNLRASLIEFLKSNRDVFAWKQSNMTRIDPAKTVYKMNVNPSFKSI